MFPTKLKHICTEDDVTNCTSLRNKFLITQIIIDVLTLYIGIYGLRNKRVEESMFNLQLW